MRNTSMLVVLALAAGAAAPLSAQITSGRERVSDRTGRAADTRDRISVRERIADARRRAEEARARAEGRTASDAARGNRNIPPGHLPPAGVCRLWIDGVPPGRQPAVTDCVTAERQRLGHANARVIYGDQSAFPGRANGKFKNSSGRRGGILGIGRDDDDRFENGGRRAAKAAKRKGR